MCVWIVQAICKYLTHRIQGASSAATEKQAERASASKKSVKPEDVLDKIKATFPSFDRVKLEGFDGKEIANPMWYI